MFNIKTLSILAIAGTAIAAPQGGSGGWGGWAGKYFGQGQNGGNWGGNNQAQGGVATQVDVVTAYTTVTWNGGNWGGNGAQPTGMPAAAQPSSAPAAQSQAPAAAAPSGGQGTPAQSGGSTTDYMTTVNFWRARLGLSDLTQNSQLQSNDQTTVNDGNGQMVHQLLSGTFAQVLAPGSSDDFVKAFVGGWLCEKPDMPGMDGICATMSQGWAYNGETGHADILTNPAYSKIGCAFADGIWGCDLA